MGCPLSSPQQAVVHPVGFFEAFAYAGLDWRDYVVIDPQYYRPSEVELLVGDARKAKQTLEWEAKTTFKDLVSLMVNADMLALKRPGLPRR